MNKRPLITALAGVTLFAFGSALGAPPAPKVTLCHKYNTPDEATLTVGYPASLAHFQNHGDFLGACPQFDRFIDVDGIATAGRGVPAGINVQYGDPLTSWPTGFWTEGLDWFDNDGTCTWTMGDDLHLEDPQGACITAIRDGVHEVGFDCALLDLDNSFFNFQQVDVDLETGTTFTGCPGPDPFVRFYDQNGNGFYDNGEDIVYDSNGDGVFN